MITMALMHFLTIPMAYLIQIFPWLGSIIDKSFETLLNLMGVFPK